MNQTSWSRFDSTVRMPERIEFGKGISPAVPACFALPQLMWLLMDVGILEQVISFLLCLPSGAVLGKAALQNNIIAFVILSGNNTPNHSFCISTCQNLNHFIHQMYCNECSGICLDGSIMLHSQRADSASVKLREIMLTKGIPATEMDCVMLGVFIMNIIKVERIILLYNNLYLLCVAF